MAESFYRGFYIDRAFSYFGSFLPLKISQQSGSFYRKNGSIRSPIFVRQGKSTENRL
jgi:hypothetical protein